MKNRTKLIIVMVVVVILSIIFVNTAPNITDKSGSGSSADEQTAENASGATAEIVKEDPERYGKPHIKAQITTVGTEDYNMIPKDTDITPTVEITLTPESIETKKSNITDDIKKEAKENADSINSTNTPTPTKSGTPLIPTVKENFPTLVINTETPTPVNKVITPVPSVKINVPTPYAKEKTPTPTTKISTPIPSLKVSTPIPTIKINTPTPTETPHICTSFEQISKTVTVPMQIVDVDKGPYDEEILTDQVYWCMSCGKSEYDLGYRTYDMETGKTIWEDYDGFVDHVHICWAATGKGGSWNDFKQQVIAVIHHDHCYGKEIIPAHEEIVHGRKCTFCGSEYWE